MIICACVCVCDYASVIHVCVCGIHSDTYQHPATACSLKSAGMHNSMRDMRHTASLPEWYAALLVTEVSTTEVDDVN